MARVWVVEDDRSIAELVRLYLGRDGHEIALIENGAVAVERFSACIAAGAPLDLLVLDLMLPGLDGRGVARRIRAVSETPIIMLTALDDDRDKIEGLDLGADDYLTKPFNPNELRARVRAILRRTTRTATPGERAGGEDDLRCGNVLIEAAARRVTVAGVELPLRTKEFDLLVALADHLHLVLTREQVWSRVWGGEFDGDTRTVDVHVSRLRDRLAAGGASISIDTVRSVGYRLTRSGRDRA